MSKYYVISNLKSGLHFTLDGLKKKIASHLRLPVCAIEHCAILKQSVDARKKPRLYFVLQMEFTLAEGFELKNLPQGVLAFEKSKLVIETPDDLKALKGHVKKDLKVIVVGAGPAGLFAALALAEAGIQTLVLERGKPVETRMQDIGDLRAKGILNPESNICFGEGGAGAYTDGKLYTRIKHPYVRWVLKRFVDFGAPEETLTLAHPHLGTDKLLLIVKNMREHMKSLGVEFLFQTKMKRVLSREGAACGVQLEDGREIAADHVVLAIGHSARDTIETLYAEGIQIEAKDFSVGVRTEHEQAFINESQFGQAKRHEVLGSADYSLTCQVPDSKMKERGVYSFCMCPGGFIVPSPTELGHMAINGMSNSNRSADFANSGVVVQVTAEDLKREGYKDNALIGIAFQRDLEQRTFKKTKKAYAAPAMLIADFLKGKSSGRLAKSNFRPALEACEIMDIFPNWMVEALRFSFKNFDRKIRGYAQVDANLVAVESRTSSPIRITRSEEGESVSLKGLYPVGEGAGYAGGIVSAAVDGAIAAKNILAQHVTNLS